MERDEKVTQEPLYGTHPDKEISLELSEGEEEVEEEDSGGGTPPGSTSDGAIQRYFASSYRNLADATPTCAEYLKQSGSAGSKWYLDAGQFSLEVRSHDVNPTIAHDYFGELFRNAGLKGKIVLTRKTVLSNGFICFSFTGYCPIHKKDHLGDYGDWQYKVSPGRYGGFKCWTDNAWETDFMYEKFGLLEKM
jgi:hypothetical protein